MDEMQSKEILSCLSDIAYQLELLYDEHLRTNDLLCEIRDRPLLSKPSRK